MGYPLFLSECVDCLTARDQTQHLIASVSVNTRSPDDVALVQMVDPAVLQSLQPKGCVMTLCHASISAPERLHFT